MTFEHFLTNYGSFIELIVYLFLSVTLYIKTKDTKYIKEIYEKMKPILADSQEQKETMKQTFTSVVPVYRLNKMSNILEKTEDFIDLQDVLNSYKDLALNNVLQKFMPVDSELDVVADTCATVKDDLDFLQESFAIAEEYKTKFNLDPSLSTAQVFAKMQEYKSNLDIRIKELKENEKKTIEESK